MRQLPCILIGLVGTIGSSVLAEPSSSLKIMIQSLDDGRCWATVDGQSFDVKDQRLLAAALLPHDEAKPEVHIVGGMDTPYRCLGSLIYTLQRRGYNKIGFISEPPPE